MRMTCSFAWVPTSVVGLIGALLIAAAAAGDAEPPPFIETAIENGSPLWWDRVGERALRLHLLYDHERGSSNRAAGHIHIRLYAPTGTTWTLEFTHLINVWNGRPGSVASELKIVVVSADGRAWAAVPVEMVHSNLVRAAIAVTSSPVWVARIEPYRLSDLDRLIEELRGRPGVRIEPIGRTVEGRSLEMVSVGPERARYSFVVRARAHPWEAGGNWVVQGLLRRLVREGDDGARRLLTRASVHVMPMANKDGVARGMTRFNVRGADLNRRWDRPADPELAPENRALEEWIERRIREVGSPTLALDLHNDGHGRLHIARPAGVALEAYLERMALFERCLRARTWFTEGCSAATFSNPGSFGEGWLERYGITAAVLELNANYVAGRNAPPSGALWEEFGEGLVEAFNDYCDALDGR